MSPLLPELLTAHALAHRLDLRKALVACRLRQAGGQIWGVAFVSTDDPHHYVPMAGGASAIIVPVFDGGALIDLVATVMPSRAIRTRCGVATVLGREWLDHARDAGESARLFADPIAWLAGGRHGAVVLDWRSARFDLADLSSLVCDSDRLAARVDDSMRIQPHIPPLFVRERNHHAAP